MLEPTGKYQHIAYRKILSIAAMVCAAVTYLHSGTCAASLTAVPVYDTEKLCDTIAKGTPDEVRAKKLCIALERQQLNRLLRNSFTTDEFSVCLQDETLGSYFSLNTCLNELSRKREHKLSAQQKANKKLLPSYDTHAYCRRASNAVKGGQGIAMDCMAKEQDAIAELLDMHLEPTSLKLCIQMTDAVSGGYALLRDCMKGYAQNSQ